ncbi:MAG: tripartite tricarboxylate transporter permease [Desulfovibrio sp.]|jgi:putative tricarboxylic transport membrane protein|nr:tripartite tricarboxylate transporter permease [Desulfovibrio sp.]
MFADIIAGLINVFSPYSLLSIIAGTAIGIFIGAMPGLSATMGVALLLPLTFGMAPDVGVPLLMAIYCGAMYGGSISAIMLCTPGTAAAAATCLDGYPMGQKGEVGLALGYSLSASFIGGIFSALFLLLLTPPLAQISLSFGPPEYFSIAVLGLTLIATLSEDSWIRGLLSGMFGLLLACVGSDPLEGVSRYTFGFVNLLSGIDLIIALIGLFSLSQALILAMQYDRHRNLNEVPKINISGRIFPRLGELANLWKTLLKSSLIGVWVGILPGAGADLSSWISYNEAKRASKDSHLFGTGIPEGIVAAESANNAVTGGSCIPMLALGIPGSATTAVLMGGLLVHGLRPGPSFMTEHGVLSFTLMFSMFMANLAMLGLGYLGAKAGVHISKIRDEFLIPFIIVLSVIGTYAMGNSMFDVRFMVVFGFLGFLMKKTGFPVAPMVLGLILGSMAEQSMQQSLLMSFGSWSIFVTRPISAILLGIAGFSLLSVIRRMLRKNLLNR